MAALTAFGVPPPSQLKPVASADQAFGSSKESTTGGKETPLMESLYDDITMV